MTLDQRIEAIERHIKTCEIVISALNSPFYEEDHKEEHIEFETAEKNMYEQVVEDLEILKLLKDNLYFYVSREGQENIRAIFKLNEPVDTKKLEIIKDYLFREEKIDDEL